MDRPRPRWRRGDADAFTGNVTIIGQTKGGFVSVTPTPIANPTTSTINFPTGDIRANGIAAPIDDATGKASAVFKASDPARPSSSST